MNPLLARLGLTRPLVLAPMAGVSTPELVAAVSEAGGLGSLGAAYLTPEQIRAEAATIRTLTGRPFALNLFAPGEIPAVSDAQMGAALAELAPLHAALGLPAPTPPAPPQDTFAAQLEAVLDVRPAVFSFTFGRIAPELLRDIRRRGVLTIGTATSPAEAEWLAQDGVDAVVVQGGAAGGHRGGWLRDDLADTLELLTRTRQTVKLPLLAAGGLMTRDHIRAALDAGASAAQCGTAFLRAAEAGTSAPYRAALRAGSSTTLTRNFSGRPARGLKNTVTEELCAPLPYPWQNSVTRPLRTAAAAQGRAEYLSLWAGEGFGRGQDGPAAEIVAGLWPG